MSIRRRLAALVPAVLLAGALTACAGPGTAACGGLVKDVADPADPLMSRHLMDTRPDEHRDALRAAVEAMPAPFGPVLAGVDYNYGQWLHLYGAPGGALAFTSGSSPVTFLSAESMRPVWALRPTTKHYAWDTAGGHFLLLTLPPKKPIQVQAFDMATGKPRWCQPLQSFYADGDPLTTSSLADGSVLVAAKSGSSAEVVRLRARDGKLVWRELLPSVDRADFVGSFGNLVVVGGREDHNLASGEFEVPDGPSITAVSARTGQLVWRYWPKDAGHVLGVVGDHLLVLERSQQQVRLVAVRVDGKVKWTRPLPPTALQSTLRGGVVLLKSRDQYLGYDGHNGKPLWHWKIPARTTFAPYGFTLDQMPSLDSFHLLLPTTKQLWLFDVRVGRPAAKYDLPTDGINTTYWPYELVATDRLLGVVTNTGAVVARRE